MIMTLPLAMKLKIIEKKIGCLGMNFLNCIRCHNEIDIKFDSLSGNFVVFCPYCRQCWDYNIFVNKFNEIKKIKDCSI